MRRFLLNPQRSAQHARFQSPQRHPAAPEHSQTRTAVSSLTMYASCATPGHLLPALADPPQASNHQRRPACCVQVHCRLYHWSIRPALVRRARLANIHAERIQTFNPTPERPFVLGLPTGASPVLIYQNLVQRFKAGDVSFRNVVTFNMVRSPARAPCCTTSHSSMVVDSGLLW